MPTSVPEGKETDATFDRLPETTVSFPVLVPKHIEEAARERMEQMKHAPEDTMYRPNFEKMEESEVLEIFLLDHFHLNPQWLTRDVENGQFGEPVTEALYTCVTEDQHTAIVDAANEEGENIQEFVRKAVFERAGVSTE